MAKLPPDPNQRILDLERKVAELERVTRREHAHNLRDHADTDLSQTANASWVPSYNPLTGKWELGASAGSPSAYFSVADTSIPTGGSTQLGFYLESQYGDVFSVAPGSPGTAIDADVASVLLVTAYLKLASGVSTTLNLDMGTVYEDVAPSGQSAHIAMVQPLAIGGSGTARVYLFVNHNGAGSVSVTEGYVGITQLWAI